MKSIFKTLAISALVFGAATAQAIPVEISFTADNVTGAGGLCSNSACFSGTGWSALGATPNTGNWRAADSVTVDLGVGTHWFAWLVNNTGTGSANNPAALLAEILWDGSSNSSSVLWEISTDNRSSWEAATSYGANGGNNIWNSVNGGPVAGISGDAEWIWTPYNHNIEMHNSAWVRTSITIASVPEPGTLALLGLGLAGMGFSRRRKS